MTPLHGRCYPGDPIEQWNAIHPDNPAQFVHAPGETDEQDERMVDDAEPGGEPTADVYLLDVVWVAQFVDNGCTRELDPDTLAHHDLDDFVAKVLRSCPAATTSAGSRRRS